jgi:GTP cyclohydrolase II
MNTLPLARVRTQLTLPLELGDGFSTTAQVFTFDGLADGREHLALGLGDRVGAHLSDTRTDPPLVRLHSECLTGDVLGSQRCDCGPQLREGVARIAACGGYLLYLRQEGRGIGLYAKRDAYELQEAGLDAQMLLALGERRVELLTNNPDKAEQLERHGVAVTERVPTGVHLSPANGPYLVAKAQRGAHSLDLG